MVLSFVQLKWVWKIYSPSFYPQNKTFLSEKPNFRASALIKCEYIPPQYLGAFFNKISISRNKKPCDARCVAGLYFNLRYQCHKKMIENVKIVLDFYEVKFALKLFKRV